MKIKTKIYTPVGTFESTWGEATEGEVIEIQETITERINDLDYYSLETEGSIRYFNRDILRQSVVEIMTKND